MRSDSSRDWYRFNSEFVFRNKQCSAKIRDPKRDGATAVYLQKASHQRREVQAKSTGGRVGL